MHSSNTLYSFLILHLAISLSHCLSCEAGCPISGTKQICASNGKVYGNLCKAQCARSWTEEVFVCGKNMNFNDCSDKCKEKVLGIKPKPKPKPTCQSKCPVYIQAQGICASNNVVYTDMCRARCINPNLKLKFACGFPFKYSACKLKCQDPVPPRPKPTCQSRCPVYKRAQGVCTSNGVVYTDMCQAHCIYPKLTKRFNCGFPYNYSACKLKCQDPVPPKPKPTCQSKCPVYIRAQGICASDNNIYTDLCRARCVNPHLTMKFACGYPYFPSACKHKCRSSVAPPAKCCRPYGWVCSYEGNVYPSECHLNQTKDELRFKCWQNDFNSRFGCQHICNAFRNDPCLKNCFDNEGEEICYQNGFVMRDKCLARCDRLRPLFRCRGRHRRNCRADCWRNQC